MAELAIAGSIIQGIGMISQGNAARASANARAAQMEQQAGQQRATGQRAAIEERRRGDIALSRMQALSAASGGGAFDKSIESLTGGLARQTEYNALTRLFESEDSAIGMEYGAQVERAEGKAKRRAGLIGGLGTIATGVAKGAGMAGGFDSMYSKYFN